MSSNIGSGWGASLCAYEFQRWPERLSSSDYHNVFELSALGFEQWLGIQTVVHGFLVQLFFTVCTLAVRASLIFSGHSGVAQSVIQPKNASKEAIALCVGPPGTDWTNQNVHFPGKFK